MTTRPPLESDLAGPDLCSRIRGPRDPPLPTSPARSGSSGSDAWRGGVGSASSGSLSLDVEPTLMLHAASVPPPWPPPIETVVTPAGPQHTSGSLLLLDTADSRDILRSMRRPGSSERA
ncbi:hypothetical protein CRUP_009570 [Coryphaenoides rupestris]|nr:hypothetical protein CRUP_009570 [Coryphaenoides rupestris]